MPSVTANEDQMFMLNQFAGDTLLKGAALRRHKNHGRIRAPDRFDGFKERLGLHHHAGPSTIGAVIDRTVYIGGEIARIDKVEMGQSELFRAFHHAFAEKTVQHARENRDDVNIQAFTHMHVPGFGLPGR